MSVAYDRAQHGKIEWPMPHPGVWLRSDERPDEEAFWRLEEAELHPMHFRREAVVPAFQGFAFGGRECVWLDVAEPAPQQRLFAINADATMTALDHWRARS